MTDDNAVGPSALARWGRRVGKAMVWALLLTSLAVILAFVLIPRLAGATPYTVLTGSMTPKMPAGSVVVVREVPFEEIGVGDVITYQLRSGEDTVVTHRVIGIDVVAGSETRLRTQGDANATPDPERVRAEQVRGQVWYHAPYIGYLSTATDTDTREWAARLIGAGLLGYAGYLVVSAIRGRQDRSD